ncbi:MAG: DUF3106 domain-containing protein [Janthinobacterium lividum]
MNSQRALAVASITVIAAAICYGALYPRWHATPPNAAHEAGVVAAPAIANANETPPTSIAIAPIRGRRVPVIAALNPNASHAPSWAQLSDAQHAALAPYAKVWDDFSDARKRRWLKIAAAYPQMNAETQLRLHARMLEWTGMTPEQKRLARENYQLSKTMPPQTREHAWTAYQNLSDEQKKRLAAYERRTRKPLVVSAPPTGVRPLPDPRHLAASQPEGMLPRDSVAPRSGVETPRSAAAAALAGSSETDSGAPVQEPVAKVGAKPPPTPASRLLEQERP